MRVGQGTSGVLTAGAPRAGAQGVRASRAGRLTKGQRCAIRAYFFPEKSFFKVSGETARGHLAEQKC